VARDHPDLTRTGAREVTQVVFAVQAPTLLNILAHSRASDLSVLDLGHSGALAEVALSKVKPYLRRQRSACVRVLACAT
jgi:hypothetical protein